MAAHKDRCVAGAIYNYSAQLSAGRKQNSEHGCKSSRWAASEKRWRRLNQHIFQRDVLVCNKSDSIILRCSQII